MDDRAAPSRRLAGTVSDLVLGLVAAVLLDTLGATTGVDLDRLIAVARDLEQVIGRQLPGQVMRSGPAFPAGR